MSGKYDNKWPPKPLTKEEDSALSKELYDKMQKDLSAQERQFFSAYSSDNLEISFSFSHVPQAFCDSYFRRCFQVITSQETREE